MIACRKPIWKSVCANLASIDEGQRHLALLIFGLLSFPAISRADSCEKMDPLSGLIYIGSAFLLLTSALILTDHFLDPGTQLGVRGAELEVSFKRNILSPREAAPHWYWITNMALVAVSSLIIFAGFVLERPVNCYVGTRVQGEYPRVIPGCPLYAYATFFCLLALGWMPLLDLFRKELDRFFGSRFNMGRITTARGLKVEIPLEVLNDPSALRDFLYQFRAHSDYEEICEIALKRSVRVRSN